MPEQPPERPDEPRPDLEWPSEDLHPTQPGSAAGGPADDQASHSEEPDGLTAQERILGVSQPQWQPPADAEAPEPPAAPVPPPPDAGPPGPRPLAPSDASALPPPPQSTGLPPPPESPEFPPPSEYLQLPADTPPEFQEAGAGPYAQTGPPPLGGPAPIDRPVQPGPYAVAGGQPGAEAQAAEDAPKKHFRPDVEGLRAIAIIAVLLFHIGLPATAGGYVGVDVFFVISGFLITGLLLREGEVGGKVDLVAFYARRMRRLLPAALIVIVVTLAASAVILSPLRLTGVAGDAAAAALYVANFRFAIEATDYLAVEATSPLLHFWSLGVEEQFYLVWPLIMLVGVRLLTLRFLGPAIFVLAIASFGLSLYWTDTSPAWAFFSPVTRAWELAAGALLAVGLLRIPQRAPRLLASVSVWLGLVLIVIAVILITDETPFPGVAALLPVVGAVLVILGGMRGQTLPGKLIANPVFRYVGRISYSLYLWHWPILILIPIALENDDLTFRVALAGVAVVVAAVSTELIEQPFRRGTFLSKRPRGSVQLGLTSSVAVGAAALLVSGAITIPTPWISPDPVIVELAGVREDLPRNYADGCHLDYPVTDPADCVYGDLDGSKTAFLFGDSHAAQWLPALDAYARDKGWRLESHTKSACSPVPMTLWERKLRRVYDECFEWRKAVTKRIRKTDPEVVFVGSSRDYEVWNGGRVEQTREIYPRVREDLATLLSDLDTKARRVVLLAETPFLNFDPIDCLADPDIANCDPPARIVVDRDYSAVETGAADDAGVSVLSANELLCPGLTCPVVVDDTVVFRDKHHVTATYMQQLARPITNLLEGRAPYPSPSPSGDPAPQEGVTAPQDGATAARA